MYYAAIYRLLRMAYALVLRPLVLKAVADPDSDLDDTIMSILDSLFQFDDSKTD